MAKSITLDTKKLPTLSCCMIVKNEEDNLKRLLPLLKACMDELIIVDTGSTDGTKEVIKQYTDNVYDFE
ncbi:MAG TPA: glycosyltransferase, partial [Candidatus Pacearchaeota archaeon]|nr:glycosyltransferase [Candidatus Pacearchaeota archaeon]